MKINKYKVSSKVLKFHIYAYIIGIVSATLFLIINFIYLSVKALTGLGE